MFKVLETAKEIGEIGAGVHVAPNLTRLLHKFGLGEQLSCHATVPLYVRQVRWQNGAELTRFNLNEGERMEKTFNYKYHYVHRVDLQAILLKRTKELGVAIKAGCEVVEHILDANSKVESREAVLTADGRHFEANLVIAADGARSRLCEAVLGAKVSAVPTGDSAYRAMLTREQLSDSIFDSLRLDVGSVVWLGPFRHVVGYYVRGGRFYNLLLAVPANEVNEESWKLKGDPEKLRKEFEGWDQRLRKMVDMIDTPYLWSLRDRPNLATWLHGAGNLVLL